MNQYEQIRLIAAYLADNSTVRTTCPWCHGGHSKEESFRITKDGSTALYHCFRAGCVSSSSGALSVVGNPSSMAPRIKPIKAKQREFDWETFPCSDATYDRIWDKYRIDGRTVRTYGLRQTHAGDIVVPLFNSNGTRGGHLVRFNASALPKVLTFFGDSSCRLAYFFKWRGYSKPRTDTLLLVEDVFSAMRVADDCDAVALLGTGLNIKQAADIASLNYKRVVIALDEDASVVAVRMWCRHRTNIANLEVRLLKDKDIKNMTIDESAVLMRSILN